MSASRPACNVSPAEAAERPSRPPPSRDALKDPFRAFNLDPPVIFSFAGVAGAKRRGPAKRSRRANAPKVLP